MKKLEIIYFLKENKKLQKRIRHLEDSILENDIHKEYLTIKEICEHFKISRKTFDRYRYAQLIKVIQPKKNGKILVKKSEIEKLLKTRNYAR